MARKASTSARSSVICPSPWAIVSSRAAKAESISPALRTVAVFRRGEAPPRAGFGLAWFPGAPDQACGLRWRDGLAAVGKGAALALVDRLPVFVMPRGCEAFLVPAMECLVGCWAPEASAHRRVAPR